MRNFISTPNTHIKKLLAKHFKVLTLDEFRTLQYLKDKTRPYNFRRDVKI